MTVLLAPQPAAADRHPGARLLVARDARRPALLPAGGDGGGVPGQGRLPVGARHRRAAPARPDRRRRGAPAGHQPAHLGGVDRPHPRRPDGAPAAPGAAQSDRPGDRRRAAARSRAKLVLCGTDGAREGECWNGSPYQPVPVAQGPRRRHRAPHQRAARGLPGRGRRAADGARLPPALRHQRGPPARLPQSDHRGRADHRRARRRHLGQRRLGGRPGRRREGVRRVAARAARLRTREGQRQRRGDRRGGGHRRRSPATPWSPRSTRRCRASSSASCTG